MVSSNRSEALPANAASIGKDGAPALSGIASEEPVLPHTAAL